jgi:hypothetical protein
MFSEAKKFKVSDKTLNPFQKPLLLFMKHILCWSNEGDLIIDATLGSGTTTVGYLTSIFFEFYNRKNKFVILLSNTYGWQHLGSNMNVLKKNGGNSAQ